MLLNVKDMVCKNNNKIIIIIILILLIPSGMVDISSCTESIASLSELRYLHLKNIVEHNFGELWLNTA